MVQALRRKNLAWRVTLFQRPYVLQTLVAPGLTEQLPVCGIPSTYEELSSKTGANAIVNVTFQSSDLLNKVFRQLELLQMHSYYSAYCYMIVQGDSCNGKPELFCYL